MVHPRPAGEEQRGRAAPGDDRYRGGEHDRRRVPIGRSGARSVRIRQCSAVDAGEEHAEGREHREPGEAPDASPGTARGTASAARAGQTPKYV